MPGPMTEADLLALWKRCVKEYIEGDWRLIVTKNRITLDNKGVVFYCRDLKLPKPVHRLTKKDLVKLFKKARHQYDAFLKKMKGSLVEQVDKAIELRMANK